MPAVDRLRRTVAALCSPATAGRGAGTTEGAAARVLVATAFADLALQPRGEHGYLQLVPAMAGANLLGAIPGDAPGWIVLAAHYDHLGTIDDEVYPGADDNAAGVAVLLEVAHRLATAAHHGRSILISAYDAEEPPWFDTPDMGSRWWVDHPTVPLTAIDLMVCLDLVGHSIGPPGSPAPVANTVFVAGADLAPGLANSVRVATVAGIVPRPIADWVEDPMSDHLAFRGAGIPHLFYTCARSAGYHTPRDRPELLDYDKLAALADHLTAMITAACVAAPGSWSFDRMGADDTATIDTMLALVDAVPDHDLIADAVAHLKGMRRGDRLDDDDRYWVRALVAAVESLLG